MVCLGSRRFSGSSQPTSEQLAATKALKVKDMEETNEILRQTAIFF